MVVTSETTPLDGAALDGWVTAAIRVVTALFPQWRCIDRLKAA